MSKIALYLAGGGARGAYQAGVLKAIHTILDSKKIPFHMITGVSVGSINAAVIAENALDFAAGTNKLYDLWNNITCQHIFKSSNYALSMSAMRNMSSMLTKQRLLGHVLDTSPLRQFINNIVNFDILESVIKNKHLEMMEIISNCYEMQKRFLFISITKRILKIGTIRSTAVKGSICAWSIFWLLPHCHYFSPLPK